MSAPMEFHKFILLCALGFAAFLALAECLWFVADSMEFLK